MSFDNRETQDKDARHAIPSANPATGVSLGHALRARRKEIGKTLKQIALEAGLTEGFVSQVERGLSTPSLISLYNVANALGASVDTFLRQTPQHSHSLASHRNERRGYSIEAEERVYEILERGFPGAQLNACITHMPPGYNSELTRHEGEDFLYLIEGEMLYEIGGREYRLSAGDTLHFPASLPHRARNVGAGSARELWVGTTRIIPEE